MDCPNCSAEAGELIQCDSCGVDGCAHCMTDQGGNFKVCEECQEGEDG